MFSFITKYIFSLIIVILFLGCNNKNTRLLDFEIREFQPITNFKCLNDTVFLPMDLSEKINTGIEIPSLSQSNQGFFKFSFKIKNKSKNPAKFIYRLYYQNESYKIVEYETVNNKYNYNINASNNFYGSWGDGDDDFHLTKLIPSDNNWHTVIDSFKIVGNPRNELKYFGGNNKNIKRSDSIIDHQIKRISNNKDWLKSVKEKAKTNNYSLEHQLFLDALWVIRHDAAKGNMNNRWKRNPRVGNYSFSLLVCDENKKELIPPSLYSLENPINDIFINPYFDLFYNDSIVDKSNFIAIKSNIYLNTKAKFDLTSGIYSNEMEYRKPQLDTSYYCSTCGNSNLLFNRAQFEQHFHREYYNYPLSNIPISYNVIEENYSKKQYNSNIKKYNNRINDIVYSTSSPCKTVKLDSASKNLQIITPGNKYKKLKKENVALKSRIGFTYGKHIAKIKFPKMLNKENVWNGLTCAYWLLYQDANEWNNRITECNQGGYLAKGVDGPESPTSNKSFYSEIDFEILKTSNYWPSDLKLKNKKYILNESSNNRDVIIACTNWDLACKEPQNFATGLKKYSIDNNHYKFHRWDEWYKALTLKHSVHHDSIFGDYYYYVIDWQPDKITWSVGQNETDLHVIAKADNSMTMVPDNQMIIIFSQEFHPGKWWPLAPYQQDGIPYPKNDFIGEILELRIE